MTFERSALITRGKVFILFQFIHLLHVSVLQLIRTTSCYCMSFVHLHIHSNTDGVGADMPDTYWPSGATVV